LLSILRAANGTSNVLPFLDPLSLLRLCAAFLAFAVITSCDRHAHAWPDAFPVLTPPAARPPRINGAKIFGVRADSPFLFQIAATGDRPLTFAASGLPPSLSLDSETGQITGQLDVQTRHVITLRAENNLGFAERPLTIVVGERIALTPPMGWNSWNCWGGRVTQDKVSAAARALITHHLREHGWTYVNIDDGWQGLRGGAFNAIQPNPKFPNIEMLSDEIHALGLKFGLYSTPWRTSFYGHIGSSADMADGGYDWIQAGVHTGDFRYRFPKERARLEKYSWLRPLAQWLNEKRRERTTKELRTFGRFSFAPQDVKQWSAWGVDYLKYDWVPIDIAHAEEMRKELAASRRDIVYSLANNASASLAPELARRANSWRTASDLTDTWASISDIGFSREKWAPVHGPGSYNDADMLVLGEIGNGKPRRTRLTADEQYTHMSLWCLLSGPLLLGCDLEKLDAFTLGLLTNDEVLEVNQDPLCKQATRVAKSGRNEVYAKLMEDGSWAVGLFNRNEKTGRVRISWSAIGLRGAQRVRDLWRQQDLGVFAETFEAEVAPHGVVLVRVAAAP
jgi:alpha-galactosidase